MSLQQIKRQQVVIRDLIKQDIHNNPNFKSTFPNILCVRKVIQHALNSGKRLRPMITLSMSGDRLQSGMHFSLFIEYVHNASLVVDDLPCMDNDMERRGVPTVHAKYGEHIAQIAAYNLMITAMKHLSDGLRTVRDLKIYNTEHYDHLSDMVNDEVNTNLQGVGSGQMFDLLMIKEHDIRSLSRREQREIVMETIRLKTGCLFSLSFVLGYVIQGGSVDHIAKVKEIGYGFGICYQIIDDLRDCNKDMEKNGGYNNICKYYTRNEIITIFTDHMEQFSATITALNLWNPTLKEMYNYLLLSFKKSLQC